MILKNRPESQKFQEKSELKVTKIVKIDIGAEKLIVTLLTFNKTTCGLLDHKQTHYTLTDTFNFYQVACIRGLLCF